MASFMKKLGKPKWNKEKLIEILDIKEIPEDSVDTRDGPHQSFLKIMQDENFCDLMRIEDTHECHTKANRICHVLAISTPTYPPEQAQFWPPTQELINYLKEIHAGWAKIFFFKASPVHDDGKPSYLYRCLSRQLLEHVDADKFTYHKKMEDEKYGSMHIFNTIVDMFDEKHKGASGTIVVYFILHALGHNLSQDSSMVTALLAIAQSRTKSVKYKVILTPPLPLLLEQKDLPGLRTCSAGSCSGSG
jgi:hypothetical protein